MFCKMCGAENAGDAKFCVKCGQSLSASAPVTSSTPVANPVQASPAVSPVTSPTTILAPVIIWKRLVEYILDIIFIEVVSFIVGIVIGLVHLALGATDASIGSWSILVGWIVVLLYYIISEALWQKTLAKLIMKTKVVMKDGTKPPLKNIIGRSFARFIPFEAFSFLFSAHPVGWHDSLSGTMVVPSSYSEQDVKSIDFAKVKQASGGNTVLIIIGVFVGLLVVVAIIGILASVVLVSLSSARQKGFDARTMSDLSQMRVLAETYYGDNNSYLPAQDCTSGLFQIQGMEAPK